MPAKKEVSNNEILEAVNYLKQNSATKKELTELSASVNYLKQNSATKKEIGDLKGEMRDVLEIVNFIKDTGATQKSVDDLNKRLTRVEALMVDKPYLDEKFSDQRGDMVVMMRKENTKVVTLAEILHKRKLITDQDLKSLVTMEPFAQLV